MILEKQQSSPERIKIKNIVAENEKEMTDMVDDSCAGSFQLLGTPKKKKKKKNKLEKLNGKMNEQSVNSVHHSSFSSDHSSVFPWHVNNQDIEDNQTQQQKCKRGVKDRGDDSCVGNFQLLGSSKKKKKKKNKLEKLSVETNEQSLNPFFHRSFSSGYVDSQDTEDIQCQQQKYKRGKKDTRETLDSQLENSGIVTESNFDDEVGTVTVNKKKKRKSSKQDSDNELYVPETPEEANSLLEGDQLEVVDSSCEITPKKKKKKKKKLAKVLLEEQVEASVGRTDFASDSEYTQEYLFASPSQTPSKTQDADFLQNKTGQKLSIPDPSAQKRLRKHRKDSSISSPTGNSDATKDSLLVKDTVEANEKHDKSEKCHMLQKSALSVHADEKGSSEPVILDNEFLESPDFQMQDLESVTQELEEFIPHVRKLSDSLIKQLAIRDLVRFKNFKKQGVYDP
ncbi:hypothetical protein JD844_004576 [Phrynosoma platyrhinos]|uniref:Uncharacterized protein n=1 Tax=Phrynosoma platyrhinos TaxID=52577 RepID=A0ABQ7SDI4_PHRPL|nr:hypothetical protein JD844_004576 [Phrynosoma platyrhinos]